MNFVTPTDMVELAESSAVDGARILVVEDSHAIREMLRELLQQEGGYHVIEAINGAAALEIAARTPPDLVVLDARLPLLDGYAVCARLRELPATADIPILMITAETDPAAESSAFAAGADDFVPKPLHVEVFLQRLRRLLRTRAAEVKLRHSEARLRILSHRLVEAHEAERRHVARELHDRVAQTLAAIKIQLETALRQRRDPLLTQASAQLSELIGEVRTLMTDLRPALLDDLGLSSALHWYGEREAQRAGYAIQVTARLDDDRLSSALETTCFRIVQEALVNVARHAEAGEVHIDLDQQEAGLVLRIQDNGRGFDVEDMQLHAHEQGKHGLIGMRERVDLLHGSLLITSGLGQGTSLVARFPAEA